jgi:hypothetical protein
VEEYYNNKVKLGIFLNPKVFPNLSFSFPPLFAKQFVGPIVIKILHNNI